MIAPDTNTIYHSLQTRYEHRFSKGLSLTAAYTWSHLIDDAGQTINAGGCICQNPRNRGKAERASSVLDQRHRAGGRLRLGIALAQPEVQPRTGPDGRWLVIGWYRHAGQRISVQRPAKRRHLECRRAVAASQPAVSGQSPTIDDRTPTRWFNTDAFSRSTTYGTAPRDPIVGPGPAHLRPVVLKGVSHALPERHSLLFRAEMFNTFNTPQFGQPRRHARHRHLRPRHQHGRR